MSRVAALSISLSVALAGCAREPIEATITPPPLTVMVVLDTLRADYVGVYGSDRGLTPRLDALAADALVYRHGIASSSWTRSSVASMFTGRNPSTVAVLSRDDVLADEVETLAEALAAYGVGTHAVSTNPHAGIEVGFAQGFDSFVHRLPTHSYPGGVAAVNAKTVTTRALELVDTLPDDEPAFLFLHYTDPHQPNFPHPEVYDVPEPPGRFGGSNAELRRLDRTPLDQLTPDDVARTKHLYAGEIAFCDHWLGAFFDGLDERGLLDEALVLVTSDHGEGLYDHDVRSHGTDLYREQIDVPFILRPPRSWGLAGREVDGVASHVDIMPTLLGVYGAESNDALQGRDLFAPLADGYYARPGELVYSEMHFAGEDLEVVTDGRRKLIRDRSFDGTKGEAGVHVFETDERFMTVVRNRYGRGANVRRVAEHNPGLVPLDGPWHDLVLPAGTELVLPAPVLHAGDDLVEWYELDDDPKERDDRSGEERRDVEAWREVLADRAAENRALGREVQRIRVEDLDAETQRRLEILGYIESDG